MARAKISDFELANRIYASATATFYVANADGTKSATLATLYSGLTGSAQLSNPQRLDDKGKLAQACYFGHADGVIATISGLSVGSHDTGVMALNPATNLAFTIVETIAALKVLAGGALAGTVMVMGYYAANDGGGGDFRWNASDASADNGGTIIRPNALPATGRWNRVLKSARDLTLEWFGAKGDGTWNDFVSGTDNLAAWNALIAALPASGADGGILRFGTLGTYRVSAPPNLRADLKIIGLSEGFPFGQKPLLICSTTGAVLDVAYQYVHLQGFQVLGDPSQATSVGIRIRESHCSADDLTCAGFSGAGAIGFYLAGTAAGVGGSYYFRAGRIWCNANETGFKAGDGTYGHTNSASIQSLMSTGNAGDGVNVNGVNGLTIAHMVSEGNGTSGTGANVRVVKAKNIKVWGHTELELAETGTRKNIVLPAAVASDSANIWIEGYAAGDVGANFNEERDRSFFLSSPWQFAADEPMHVTALGMNSLHMPFFDNDGVAIGKKPVFEMAGGPLLIGALDALVAGCVGGILMRNIRSLADNGTINLTTYLAGDRLTDMGGAIGGALLVFSDQDSAFSLYTLKGTMTREELDTQNVFTGAAGGAATNIYYSTTGGAHFELENNTGSPRNYSLYLFLSN